MSSKRKELKERRLKRIEKRKRRKRIYYLFAFIIILISVVVTAWYVTSRPKPTGTLIIHVVDEDTNKTISGAIIRIARADEPGKYGASNEQGVYRFESIPVGNYTVTVTEEGYHVHPETVIVEAKKTTDHTVKLHTHH